MSHVQTPQPRRRPDWLKSVTAALVASGVVAVVLLAFAWPTMTSTTENLPVAIVGTQEQIDAVTEKMPENMLDLHPVAHREDAVNGIRTREVYGGIVLGEQPEFLTASAASPVASQMLSGMATTVAIAMATRTISIVAGRRSRIRSSAGWRKT